MPRHVPRINVVEIFAKELHAEVELGKAKIDVTPAVGGEGVDVRVSPTNHRSAPIEAFCSPSEGLIYLTVGAHTRMEVPLDGKRCSMLDDTDELAAIIDAVKHGEVMEILWSKHGEIVKSKASMRVNNRLRTLSSFTPFAFPLGRSKEIRDYEPY